MEKNYTNEEIEKIYEQLPEDLKSAIFSVKMGETVKVIGDKYKLMIDKIGALGNEAGMVMLGLTHPNEFIPNLAERLGVDKETARKIADDVNQQIFAKVRESLKAIHGIASELTPPAPPSQERGVGGEFSGTDPTTSDVKSVSPTSDVTETKEQILKELEKEEPPAIFQGTTHPQGPTFAPKDEPSPTGIFDAKMKNEVFRIPPETKKYQGGDPYREQV